MFNQTSAHRVGGSPNAMLESSFARTSKSDCEAFDPKPELEYKIYPLIVYGHIFASELQMRWGQEQRLEFIEFRLFWDGAINRSDLIEQFRISVPQASKDFAAYQERAPGNMRYDGKEKCYLAEPQFMLRFLEPDPAEYLTRLHAFADGAVAIGETWIGCPPAVDLSLPPRREVDLNVLRAIVAAIRENRSVDVLYQSMNPNRPDPAWRRISPHAFGHDGLRWHSRAFCADEARFKDFLLPRILEVGTFGESAEKSDADWAWNNFFAITLTPHPKLSDSQKAAVAKDYGFADDQGVLSVRYAMLFYVVRRLGLLGDATGEDPRRQHIVAVNQSELQSGLKLAESMGANAARINVEGERR